MTNREKGSGASGTALGTGGHRYGDRLARPKQVLDEVSDTLQDVLHCHAVLQESQWIVDLPTSLGIVLFSVKP